MIAMLYDAIVWRTHKYTMSSKTRLNKWCFSIYT